jgi:hypothetical protein
MFQSGSDKYKTKEHTQGSIVTRAFRLKTVIVAHITPVRPSVDTLREKTPAGGVECFQRMWSL